MPLTKPRLVAQNTLPNADPSPPSWSIAHASFLSSLAPEELETLRSVSRHVRVAKREAVFSAGEDADQVFVVLAGCIRVFQLSTNGRTTILWLNFPGELFGVAEALNGGRREVFAEANVDSALLVMGEPAFAEFLERHPRAAMRAFRILSARLRTLGSSIVDLAADDVPGRLAHLLLRYASSGLTLRCGVSCEPGEVCLDIGLTQGDLANLIGASRQTVTSVLASFRRRGLIRSTARHIHILDVQGLRRTADLH